MKKTNTEFFHECGLQKNMEPLFDPNYQNGTCVITKTKNAPQNNLIKKNAQLIEEISKFNKLKNNGHNSNKIKPILDKVIKIVTSTKKINYSPLVQFFMAYNLTYGIFCDICKSSKYNEEQKRKFVYDLLKKYCEERHKIYMSHGYSNVILQVMADNYSHKRNSKAGINKVTQILESHGVKKCDYLTNGKKNNFFFLPDKDGKELFNEFLTKNHIEFMSRKDNQNKLPDIVFKCGNDYYIMELKSLKEGGGGQNKQIAEIISFVHNKEKKQNTHYIAFIDGLYANKFFSDEQSSKKNKLTKQRKDALNALKNNPSNYFVNTAGFKLLCKEIFQQ